MTRFRSVLALPIVLAACAGGGAATTQSVPTTGAGATSAPATVGAVASADAGATPGAGATAAAGDANAWCLNTPPEVEAALHVMGVVATGSENTGLGGGCTYSLADGTLVHAIAVVNSPNFEATFEAAKSAPGAVEISGIGKGAVLVSAAGPLVILTDKGMISMGPVGPADLMADPAAYRTAVEALAKAAVDRLP